MVDDLLSVARRSCKFYVPMVTPFQEDIGPPAEYTSEFFSLDAIEKNRNKNASRKRGIGVK